MKSVNAQLRDAIDHDVFFDLEKNYLDGYLFMLTLWKRMVNDRLYINGFIYET